MDFSTGLEDLAVRGGFDYDGVEEFGGGLSGVSEKLEMGFLNFHIPISLQ